MKIRMQKIPPAHVSWGVVSTPATGLVIGLTERGEVCRAAFMRGRQPVEIVAEWQAQWPRTVFSPGAAVADDRSQPLCLVGSDFQQAVWKAMLKIPAGKTATYGELAARVGHPGAARAVGTACGANPVPYLVPCHRVVAANGGWGGFLGGIALKKKLLAAEGCFAL